MKAVLSRTFVLLFVVLLSFSSLAIFNVKAQFPVKPTHAIYIEVTGNISPETDLIIRNGNIYTLTEDIINHPIVIEKENIILDGNGFSLIGNGSYAGVEMSYRVNVTIKDLTITDYGDGIYSYNSADNLFFGNTIKDNTRYGIRLDGASRCNITDNVVENNKEGIGVIGYQYGGFCYITGNVVRYNSGVGINTFSDNILENNIVEGNGVNYNIVLISETPTQWIEEYRGFNIIEVEKKYGVTETLQITFISPLFSSIEEAKEWIDAGPTTTPAPNEPEFPTSIAVASIAIIAVIGMGIFVYFKKFKN